MTNTPAYHITISIITEKYISCRIFAHLATRQLIKSTCSKTTYPHLFWPLGREARTLSWLPPLSYFRISNVESFELLMSTSKRLFGAKFILNIIVCTTGFKPRQSLSERKITFLSELASYLDLTPKCHNFLNIAKGFILIRQHVLPSGSWWCLNRKLSHRFYWEMFKLTGLSTEKHKTVFLWRLNTQHNDTWQAHLV